jgi:hypothetical protein
MPNYQNGTIYKIVCKDKNITDCYVGSTICHNARKSQHKSDCNNEKSKNYNLPVYRFIRDNGGWDNWEFVLLEDYPCNKKKQLNIRERYWFELLNATLNSKYPERSKKEYLNRPEVKEHRKEYKKQYNKEYLNRPEVKEHRKEYRNRPENKQHRNQYLKEYYNRPEVKEHLKEKGKEYYKERCKIKYVCNACNKELTLINKNRHEKTQKHIRNLEKLNS